VCPALRGARAGPGSEHGAEDRGVDGARHPRLAREVRGEADRALALLEEGLGRYAVKDPGTTLPG
jgi:hypothetical protein